MFNYNNRVETTLNLNSPPLKPLLFTVCQSTLNLCVYPLHCVIYYLQVSVLFSTTQSRLPMLGTHDISAALLYNILATLEPVVL